MQEQQIYDMLRCPACKADLAWSEPIAELLCCPCGHAYPVIDGIPVLFPAT